MKINLVLQKSLGSTSDHKELFAPEIICDSNKWTSPRNSAAGHRWFFKLFHFFSLARDILAIWAAKWFLFQLCSSSEDVYGKCWVGYTWSFISEHTVGVLFHHSSFGDCVACGKSRANQFLPVLIRGWVISRSRWTDLAQTQNKIKIKIMGPFKPSINHEFLLPPERSKPWGEPAWRMLYSRRSF